MRILSAVLLIAGVTACAPAPELIQSLGREGAQKVIADFEYSVGKNDIRGSFNPQIFEKNRVLGHARRGCIQDEITSYNENRRSSRVAFSVRCRFGVKQEAQGRWLVQRGENGEERARRI